MDMIDTIAGKVGEGLGLALQAINPRNPLGTATDRAKQEVRRYACICSVYVGGQGKGTGFLVGPEFVLTNFQVVIDEHGLCGPSRITCRFGFFDEDDYQQGRLDWVALKGGSEEAFAAISPIAPGDNKSERPSIKAEDYREPGGTRVLSHELSPSRRSAPASHSRHCIRVHSLRFRFRGGRGTRLVVSLWAACFAVIDTADLKAAEDLALQVVATAPAGGCTSSVSEVKTTDRISASSKRDLLCTDADGLKTELQRYG